ncbi:hypothetical protein AKO1_002403 [Acrasis kona]|uniref:Uncharacterized protein n=1 Tax=Acrasis kona TaxID=1008807 RepID=A0AAW2ZMX1_9EUKA
MLKNCRCIFARTSVRHYTLSQRKFDYDENLAPPLDIPFIISVKARNTDVVKKTLQINSMSNSRNVIYETEKIMHSVPIFERDPAFYVACLKVFIRTDSVKKVVKTISEILQEPQHLSKSVQYMTFQYLCKRDDSDGLLEQVINLITDAGVKISPLMLKPLLEEQKVKEAIALLYRSKDVVDPDINAEDVLTIVKLMSKMDLHGFALLVCLLAETWSPGSVDSRTNKILMRFCAPQAKDDYDTITLVVVAMCKRGASIAHIFRELTSYSHEERFKFLQRLYANILNQLDSFEPRVISQVLCLFAESKLERENLDTLREMLISLYLRVRSDNLSYEIKNPACYSLIISFAHSNDVFDAFPELLNEDVIRHTLIGLDNSTLEKYTKDRKHDALVKILQEKFYPDGGLDIRTVERVK